MEKKSNLSLFIFTRDLRLDDNIPLITALENSKNVIPIFIFDHNQITDKNRYKSNNCIQFMIECLDELNNELIKLNSKIYYFYTDNKCDYESLLIKIIDFTKTETIYITKDYTPYAKKRENILQKICKIKNINFYLIENHMLNNCEKIKKNDGTYYKKFTPYYKSALKYTIEKPIKNKYINYIKNTYKIKGEYTKSIHDFYVKNEKIIVHGGRKNALKILNKIVKFNTYNVDREIPSLNGTTKLSAYLKFNVVSVREVYFIFNKKLSKNNKLITQLYWRDFYMQLMHNFENINYMSKSNKIIWDNNKNYINKWKNGMTGIPIIDAGMRQMNITGWMHNRLRMITSNFFIKILRCDWRIGEQYFAQNLLDYDFANNRGGWLWNCGSKKLSGVDINIDSQMYFRVFNPFTQANKYDKECEYIKTYIEELKDVPNKDILNWNNTYSKYKNTKYPKPIVTNINDEFKILLKLLNK
jgi:deoxyribodipyrimidine photo-lyase